MIGIIRFVGNDIASLIPGQQGFGLSNIVALKCEEWLGSFALTRVPYNQ